MTQQGMKVVPGQTQTAVIGGQTVRFTTASPSMLANANQVGLFSKNSSGDQIHTWIFKSLR